MLLSFPSHHKLTSKFSIQFSHNKLWRRFPLLLTFSLAWAFQDKRSDIKRVQNFNKVRGYSNPVHSKNWLPKSDPAMGELSARWLFMPSTAWINNPSEISGFSSLNLLLICCREFARDLSKSFQRYLDLIKDRNWMGKKCSFRSWGGFWWKQNEEENHNSSRKKGVGKASHHTRDVISVCTLCEKPEVSDLSCKIFERLFSNFFYSKETTRQVFSPLFRGDNLDGNEFNIQLIKRGSCSLFQRWI